MTASTSSSPTHSSRRIAGIRFQAGTHDAAMDGFDRPDRPNRTCSGVRPGRKGLPPSGRVASASEGTGCLACVVFEDLVEGRLVAEARFEREIEHRTRTPQQVAFDCLDPMQVHELIERAAQYRVEDFRDLMGRRSNRAGQTRQGQVMVPIQVSYFHLLLELLPQSRSL